MYAIGTSPHDLVSINDILLYNNGKSSKYIIVSYDIVQSECTLFNNKCTIEEILEDMKKENNTVTFKNGNILSCIEEFATTEPKVEDLKIYRLVAEEVE